MGLLIVSNRLPYRALKRASGYELIPSTGGLSTGLMSFYNEYKAKWVGWPGEVDRPGEVEALLEREGCYPVFLPREVVRGYYHGFSNGTIWPLFHGFTTYALFSKSDWRAYVQANMAFADRVEELAEPGDTIWVHDYHLMLLPKILRERGFNSIGFFLHIPFPSFDVFRLLPWRREIVEGMLGADLVGFHTYDYAQAFLDAVARVMGYDNRVGLIETEDRLVQVDVFPMSIDFDRYSKAAELPEVRERVNLIKDRVGNRSIIISISRLDYTKGPLNHLLAFETFLEEHPEWREGVTYIFIVSPSREGVERYSKLRAEIEATVGRVNGRFGVLGWVPVWYMYRYLDFHELIALYSVADVALIVPISDGMNLMAKEYLATMNHMKGALILSETAGAAKELLEAFRVNPNNIDEVAEAIREALTADRSELKERNRAMRERIRKFNVRFWAESFLKRLKDVLERNRELEVKALTDEVKDLILKGFRRASSPLLMFDYDGTLVPLAEHPSKAEPGDEVRELLSSLSERAEVVVISGRDRFSLDRWLGDLNLTLVAEHGGWVKEGGEWVTTAPIDESWKEMIRPVLEAFVNRVPGSFIEHKDFSLAWHYRRADLRIAREAVNEMIRALVNLTAGISVNVLPGKMVVEVRQAGISKGSFFRRISDRGWDFILAAGDDATDEDLFRALPDWAHSIRVGYTPSSAKYNVRRREELINLLRGLVG